MKGFVVVLYAQLETGALSQHLVFYNTENVMILFAIDIDFIIGQLNVLEPSLGRFVNLMQHETCNWQQ